MKPPENDDAVVEGEWQGITSGDRPESSPDIELGNDKATENATPADHRPRWRLASNIAWLVVSLGFVSFLLFGSIPVRTWRLGSLHIDSRSIAGVWRVQAGSLPGQFPGWLESSLFIGSILIFLAGVIVAFRLLLAPDPVGDA